ncbi:SH3 domain-containing protein [Asaia platycodi]|uniref:SH3 domain-containing protein n=1 Tax=Asaia platycodi TaxID=610243 RepID=UPI00047180AA|nr:SH3 domain-containing protein [Asaia platycodi]
MKTLRIVYGIGLTILLPFGALAEAAPQTTKHAAHHHKHAASQVAAGGKTKTPSEGAAHHKKAKGTGKKHRPAHATDEARAAKPHSGSRRHARTAVAATGVAAGAAAIAATPPPPSADEAAAAAAATDAPSQDKGTNTGLPLPRYAAMRADKVFMRKGPGQRYPIEWVYHRRGLPVEVEREFDVWRLIEDSDGMKGWVHQATLVGQRTFVIPGQAPEGHAAAVGEASAKSGDVIGKADARVLGYVPGESEARQRQGDTLLYSQSDENSAVVAVLQPGTVGTLKLCPQGSSWCKVVVKGYTGWLPRRVFWGLLPGETLQPS